MVCYPLSKNDGGLECLEDHHPFETAACQFPNPRPSIKWLPHARMRFKGIHSKRRTHEHSVERLGVDGVHCRFI